LISHIQSELSRFNIEQSKGELNSLSNLMNTTPSLKQKRWDGCTREKKIKWPFKNEEENQMQHAHFGKHLACNMRSREVDRHGHSPQRKGSFSRRGMGEGASD
jgi:hypothetical protein